MKYTNQIFTVGSGFDVHPIKKLNKESHIMLGGIPIPCHFEIVAHSDGDVVLHALTDALLGAIAQGDIGEHFPPTDPKWENKASSYFVTHALGMLKEREAKLINIDITLICEVPKINPFKTEIKNFLASLAMISPERINVKATTTEKLGFLGRNEGIAAQAVVSVMMPQK